YSGKYPVENIHPHNGYISALDDIGVVGAIIVLAGAVTMLVTITRAYRDAGISTRLRLAACIAALVSIAVHSLVDTPNIWNTALLPLAVVLAVAMRLCPPVQSSTRPFSIAPRLLLVGLLPLLFLSWYRLDGRQAAFHDAVADLRNGRFMDAAEQSTAA